jgi:hypothetical protein
MCPATDNPASCEICAVIRFLHAKNVSAAEIHRELCTVNGQNITSEGSVRRWCKIFKDGRAKKILTMKSEVVGRPLVVSDDLFQSVDKDGASQF